MTSFESLDDLRRAFRAMVVDGRRPAVRAMPDVSRWVPARGEQVVLVCGCGGSSGTTTVALALATVAGRARVIETSGGTASGLAFAASAELGAVERGWFRGSRDEAVVERRPDRVDAPDELPIPPATTEPVTIVDSSWEVHTLLASRGWLGALARSVPAVVLVARATVPGLRRLASATELVGESRTLAVTVGAKRWPRQVEQSAGTVVRRLRAAGRVIHVPELPAFALSGITPDPLPAAITRPARALLTLLEGTLS